jgi:hypothetical protein
VTTEEPAIQHKRRVDGPPTSLSVNYDSDGNVRAYDDFALLGRQQKFAPNVAYPQKHFKPPKAAKVPEKEKDLNLNNASDNVNANNSSAPPPVKEIQIDNLQVCIYVF